MKKYIKPHLETQNIVSYENISNLSDWLTANSVDDDVQITSYVLGS